VRGARIAALLAGSWRASPPPAGVDDLEDLAPLLHRSGAAALAWVRLRNTAFGEHPAAVGLQQAHRLQTLAAALHRRQVAHVFDVFRAHGVEPILFKGWAAACLYPEEGLRPYGDIDVCVRPEQEARARMAHAAVTEDCSVDVHLGLTQLDDRTLEDVYDRSEEVGLDGTLVRVLGAEDHLRLLALHLLRHEAWRPVWLTDVAAGLEGRPRDFDWGRFQSGSARRADWAATVLQLAHSLLGADMEGVPASIARRRAPAWATAAILRTWGAKGVGVPQGARLPMRHLRDPFSIMAGLWARWPGPLEATVGTGAAMNWLPRWPIQVAACAARVGRFLRGRPADGS
jgi:putative nucleotidyltransferase-like protein